MNQLKQRLILGVCAVLVGAGGARAEGKKSLKTASKPADSGLDTAAIEQLTGAKGALDAKEGSSRSRSRAVTSRPPPPASA